MELLKKCKRNTLYNKWVVARKIMNISKMIVKGQYMYMFEFVMHIKLLYDNGLYMTFVLSDIELIK